MKDVAGLERAARALAWRRRIERVRAVHALTAVVPAALVPALNAALFAALIPALARVELAEGGDAVVTALDMALVMALAKTLITALARVELAEGGDVRLVPRGRA